MIGLKRGIVILLPHNPKWGNLFRQEKKLLKQTLGTFVVDIQHIGSTSISIIKAKPIIDINIGIHNLDLKKAGEVAILLKKIGYEWRMQNSNPQNYIFVKGSEEKRTHYLHLVEYQGGVWGNDLLFRDYLRANPSIALEYERLKIKLAEKYSDNRKKYTKGKNKFIIRVLKSAGNKTKHLKR